jgi:hypothetical protein
VNVAVDVIVAEGRMTWMMVPMSGLALISRQGLPTRPELLRRRPAAYIIGSTTAKMWKLSEIVKLLKLSEMWKLSKFDVVRILIC